MIEDSKEEDLLLKTDYEMHSVVHLGLERWAFIDKATNKVIITYEFNEKLQEYQVRGGAEKLVTVKPADSSFGQLDRYLVVVIA